MARTTHVDAAALTQHHLQSSRCSSPLLQLPAELRLRIYSYVAPEFSLRYPPSQYAGLIYACKQTRSELEAEFLKVFLCSLDNLKDFMQDRIGETLVIAEPTSFHEMRNLIITRQQSAEMFTRQDPFMRPLARLFFQMLKIKVLGSHDQNLVLQQRNVRYLARYLSKYWKHERYPSAQKIVFEFEHSAEEHEFLLMDAEKSLCRNGAWIMVKDKDEEGKILRVNFEPAPGFYHARELRKRGVGGRSGLPQAF